MIMGNYFRPLRRKIGVCTLSMACLLMIGWLRSYTTQDAITISFGSSIQRVLVSNSGRLIVVHVSIVANQPIRTIPWTSFKTPNGEWELRFELSGNQIFIWQHEISKDLFFTGTTHVGANFPGYGRRWRQVPYWSVVLPLTLLSAWLLLSKPPIPKSGKS